MGWFIAGILVALLGVIPVRLAIARYQAPYPQAILTLGGDPRREQLAAQLAQDNAALKVWISTGQTPEKSQAIFQAIGVSEERYHLDFRATDTVTNFTTLVPEFKRRGIQHIYVVTSDYHMPRAMVIATIVLGYEGIAFTPVSVPSTRSEESWLRIVRDGGRSLLWIATGRTGVRVGRSLQETLLRWM
ncbi:YdcF family protein [Oculatella sp. LEGE 06141]|nr:YdcF family protein [Oculatella sp. LEGE 06141]